MFVTVLEYAIVLCLIRNQKRQRYKEQILPKLMMNARQLEKESLRISEEAQLQVYISNLDYSFAAAVPLAFFIFNLFYWIGIER